MGKKTVVLNAEKMNYDHKIDLSIISDDLTVYDHTEECDILERTKGYEVVVTKELVVSAEITAQLNESVKLICEAGTGYNNINIPACHAKGIKVCNIPAYSTQRVAQTVMTFILNLCSSMHTQQRMLVNKNRDNFTKYLGLHHVEVNGKTLGIIGYGNIAKEVVKLAIAFDMNVLVYTRTKYEDTDRIQFVDLDTVLSNSDFVSLHCPLFEETKHIINEETISKMKPTAYLINTARGPLVDEVALIQALQEGRIAGAGLDVQEVEPPVADNPLYEMENVILTPHMGWKGLETRQRMISILADNIRSYEQGNLQNEKFK